MFLCSSVIYAFAFLALASESVLANVNQADFAGDQNPLSFLKKEYCLTKPFQGHWDFGGSTLIASDYVRLTPDSQSHRGAIWGTLPVTMRHWEVQMHFKVHGSTGNLFGDGLAFWYVDPEATKFNGPVLGVQDKFRGLAVLLDTYSNNNGPHSHDHPYISAMVNNGSTTYDHDRDGTHAQLSGCTAQFRNREHDTRLSIRYVDNALWVSTDIDNKDSWLTCFQVPNVRLPTHFVFGISAMTGDLSDNHDVLSVKVYEIDSKNTNSDDPSIDYRRIEPSAESAEPERPHVDTPKDLGWSLLRIFLVVFFSLVGVVVLVVLGYVYHTRQQRHKKRFY